MSTSVVTTFFALLALVCFATTILGVGLAIGMSPRLRRGVVNGMSKVGELMSE